MNIKMPHSDYSTNGDVGDYFKLEDEIESNGYVEVKPEKDTDITPAKAFNTFVMFTYIISDISK